jgi:hypothetical protein
MKTLALTERMREVVEDTFNTLILFLFFCVALTAVVAEEVLSRLVDES